MARLGISVYPERGGTEQDLEYIRKAGDYGYERMFTCLLSVGDLKREELVDRYRLRIDEAHRAGMEVMLDVDPAVFQRLGASCEDLSIFRKMHADGIRLDAGFDAGTISRMTYNRQGMKIELNASMDPESIGYVLSYHPDRSRLVTCHNFYPQRYTGLSLEHFRKCNETVKGCGLDVAAFVSSRQEGAFGPWPVSEGLCTLELHRELPVDFQVRHLFATGLVDDVLIANAYASDKELEACAEADPAVLTFGFIPERELTDVEQAILHFEEGHVIRGDMSAYMLRSTQPRVVYRECQILPEGTRDLKRGDVVIVNDRYPRYKGELQVVLQEMPNDGRKNVIGHLPGYEQMLLDHAEPWRTFSFVMCR